MTATEQLAYDHLTDRATNAEATATEIRAQLTAERQAHEATKVKLAEAVANSASAATRASEQLAARGIAPVHKDTPQNLNETDQGDAALWERYEAAESPAKNEMRERYGAKLDAAARAYDRERAAR